MKVGQRSLVWPSLLRYIQISPHPRPQPRPWSTSQPSGPTLVPLYTLGSRVTKSLSSLVSYSALDLVGSTRHNRDERRVGWQRACAASRCSTSPASPSPILPGLPAPRVLVEGRGGCVCVCGCGLSPSDPRCVPFGLFCFSSYRSSPSSISRLVAPGRFDGQRPSFSSYPRLLRWERVGRVVLWKAQDL